MILLFFILGLLSYQAKGLSQPVIRKNSDLVGSDVVVDSGSQLDLTCEGEHPVQWVPRLSRHRGYSKATENTCTFRVERASAEFTGTYKCVYVGKETSDFSSVHVFVRDPKILFVTPPTFLRYIRKEGEDAVLPCLLTDPNATNIHFRKKNGNPLPAGMNVTINPKKGAIIQRLQPTYNDEYVCSASVGGGEKVSATFSITVIPRPPFPPAVIMKDKDHVRLLGEQLELICYTLNPTSNYNITWKHSSNMELPFPGEKPGIQGERFSIVSTMTLPAVSLNHSGNITCTGANEAGVNTSTTRLLVVEKPYIRLSPVISPLPNQDGLSIDVYEGEDVILQVNIEAYPPITVQQWEGPTFPNSSQPETTFISHNNRYEAMLFLKRLNSKEQGRYTFYANSSMTNASITFSIQTYQKPVVGVKKENESYLTCTVFGYPAPSIHWYKCQGTRQTCRENSTSDAHPLVPVQLVAVQSDEFKPVRVESVLTITPSNEKMTVECVAHNLAGESSDTFPVEQPEQLFTASLAGALGVMALLVLLLIVLLYKYKQKPKYEIRWKIIEATDGNNYTFVDPTQLPYNEKWEFPRDKLKLGKILGSGAFGKVVEATAYGMGKDDNVIRVAVKMLKGSAHSDEKEALMSELKILSHIGQHENIVNLLGACTNGGPVLVITEYCCHGDLLNFLRNKAESFLNCVVKIPDITEENSNYKNIMGQKMFIRSDSGISSTYSDSYLDMKPLCGRSLETKRASSCEDQIEDSLNMDDLIRFSYQVARGLEFLADKNCIHRDVAARNVLLTDGRVAKICDFGLARDIMNDSNYVVKGNARLPVKWMAPESIFECVYTVQSDVWSYGILLWEIFSLGKSPYPNILVDSKFYKMIQSGYQMSRPEFAPPEMYTIMKMCWNLEPTERPTFSKISQLIERQLEDVPDEAQYQNFHSEVLDEEQLDACDPAKGNEGSCEQEDEEQPLMKANNYQFC